MFPQKVKTAVVCFSLQMILLDLVLAKNWESFKILHKRHFTNEAEEAFRKNVFLKKVQTIEEHNERYRKGLETYTIGVNQFSDQTEEEFLRFKSGLQLRRTDPESVEKMTKNLSFAPVPVSFDWRKKEMVTPVKNQEDCSACWAFAATGALESHYKIHHGSKVNLSEQQLIDCVLEADGCEGGWMTDAYTYIAKTGGIYRSGDYPYKNDKNTCNYVGSETQKIKIRGYAALVEPDEHLLKKIVATEGPVSVAIDGSGAFQDYNGGVYYNPLCLQNYFTHAVVVVGYGRENGRDFWLVKNSWGRYWGLNGYAKIARNRNNHCGVASKASYPVF